MYYFFFKGGGLVFQYGTIRGELFLNVKLLFEQMIFSHFQIEKKYIYVYDWCSPSFECIHVLRMYVYMRIEYVFILTHLFTWSISSLLFHFHSKIHTFF